MCELLGLSSRHPVALEMSFLDLARKAQLVDAVGWGAVFYEQNDAYVIREPRPTGDSRLVNLLEDSGVHSKLVISHIRSATIDPVELRNTYPITREIHGRLHSFTFNGNTPNVFDLELTLDRFCPIGDTEGEFIFCWIMEQISTLQENNGNWEQKATALKLLGEQLAKMGPVNFLYSDSLRLYAFASRRSDADGIHQPGLYFTTRFFDEPKKLTPCAGLAIRSPSNTPQVLSLIANVPSNTVEWNPVEKNQLLVFENGEAINFGV